MRVSLVTDRTSYEPGQPVKMTMTLDNVSTRACASAYAPAEAKFRILDSAGVTVYDSACTDSQWDPFTVTVVPPGGSLTKTRSWDQQPNVGACPGWAWPPPGPNPRPGAYAVYGVWHYGMGPGWTPIHTDAVTIAYPTPTSFTIAVAMPTTIGVSPRT